MKKVAYMLDVFPVITETFILNEILELKKRGMKIIIFACHKFDFTPHKPLIHPEAKELVRETIYLDSVSMKMNRLQKAALHFSILLRHPVRYLRTLLFAYRKGGQTFTAFKAISSFVREMNRRKIEHVHAHFAREACEFSMLISMVTGIPYSFSTHAFDIYTRDGIDMLDHIIRAIFVVTCTAYNQRYLIRKYGVPAQKKVYLNYHGVDPRKFILSEEKSNSRISILSIGRLVEKKGFPYLIEAISFVKDTLDLGFIVTIVGDGPERKNLEQLVADLNLESWIVFKEFLPTGEIKEQYGQADIFVLPSIVADNGDQDGIPNVILEAMSMGLPVISTNISGISEVICDGVDGLLMPPNDSQALASAIVKLCQDTQLRKKLGENARKKITVHFNKADKIDKLFKFFNPK